MTKLRLVPSGAKFKLKDRPEIYTKLPEPVQRQGEWWVAVRTDGLYSFSRGHHDDKKVIMVSVPER
ncbi:hypothetical protein HZA86_05445 [Candidatus Uhrbacteria bacterium]|nr:hypothetical protein [Candidatus Uhrbacteria bacterium]